MQHTAIAPIVNPDARDERANDLFAAGLNGLRLALVEIAGTQALVEVWFINGLHVQTIRDAIAANPASAGSVFRVKGGQRLRAGPGTGEVRCIAVTDGETDADGNLISLRLSIAPVGDYSTYILELVYDPARIDPYFAELPFKFRPGCFGADCAPDWTPGRPATPAPAIDYLAKDYDSFRHTLISAMMDRVPGWRVSSEADLDQVLIDLFAAAADELSDTQDRVMNEAWLLTCRKRVSLARHARLVDYHVHQGNQASTWLVLTIAETQAPFSPDEELLAWAGGDDPAMRTHFASRETALPVAERVLLAPLLNRLRLHTWRDARPGLRAGATTADVVSDLPGAGQAGAERLRDWVRAGRLRHLLIAEQRNPKTGLTPGRDPRKRQLLRLVPEAAEALFDPLDNVWFTRLRWRDEEALRADYAFVTWCAGGERVDGISALYGNLVMTHAGLPVATHFHEPGTALPVDSQTTTHRHFRRWTLYGENRGVLCDLPSAPLAYLPTPVGGVVPPRSTLTVTVEAPGGVEETWDEVISLVHSDDSVESGDHYAVETDEQGLSVLRFGNGINGRALPGDAIVHCRYQVGSGASGNIGADVIDGFQPLGGTLSGAIVGIWNPFDVTDGRAPEAVEKIIRNAPEAFRTRQLRAITLADYAARAEEVPGVARAVARYAWTGSWRTVRVVVDPAGTDRLSPQLAADVTAHLEAVRLIGEDLEIRPPRFVPLAIEVELCLSASVWPEDIRWVLEQEFSAGWTPDGRMGFFHPDAWTFGQALHRSQIAGRLQGVAGIERIVDIRMRRFHPPPPADPAPESLICAIDEIFLARNDPDHRELGFVEFILGGGRT